MKRIVAGNFIVALVAALMVTGTALAQDKFPSKPITGIVPAWRPPGSPARVPGGDNAASPGRAARPPHLSPSR